MSAVNGNAPERTDTHPDWNPRKGRDEGGPRKDLRHQKEDRMNRLQRIVDEWNDQHPIGTPVTRYKLINPLAEPDPPTYTRSLAWVLSGHSAVIMVEGKAGCVLLESIVLRNEP